MDLNELTELRLDEAQHRRNQVVGILNAASDARRPAGAAGGVSSTAAILNNSRSSSSMHQVAAVFEGDDRSFMNLYRTSHRVGGSNTTAAPLSDVSALRVDDLITSFIKFRRSLHHLCYHPQGGSAATQMSEVGVLQERIEKIRGECFIMIEQLKSGLIDAPVETMNQDLVMSEAPEVSALRSTIVEERARLRDAMSRLEVANCSPVRSRSEFP